MSNEEAIKIFKEVREEVIAKETELSRQVFENLGIKAIDLAIKTLEQQLRDCKTCKHSDKGNCAYTEECHECMWESKYEQQPCEDCISREQAIRIAEQGQIQGYEWQFKKLCALPSVTPKGVTITDFADRCRECGKQKEVLVCK